MRLGPSSHLDPVTIPTGLPTRERRSAELAGRRARNRTAGARNPVARLKCRPRAPEKMILDGHTGIRYGRPIGRPAVETTTGETGMSIPAGTQVGDFVTYEDATNPPITYVVVHVNFDNPWDRYTLRNITTQLGTPITTDGQQGGWKIACRLNTADSSGDPEVCDGCDTDGHYVDDMESVNIDGEWVFRCESCAHQLDQQGTAHVHANGVVELDPADVRATTCGTCGRAWDNSVSTSITLTPSGHCPFEYDHSVWCAECGELTEGGCVCAGLVGDNVDDGERRGIPTPDASQTAQQSTYTWTAPDAYGTATITPTGDHAFHVEILAIDPNGQGGGNTYSTTLTNITSFGDLDIALRETIANAEGHDPDNITFGAETDPEPVRILDTFRTKYQHRTGLTVEPYYFGNPDDLNLGGALIITMGRHYLITYEQDLYLCGRYSGPAEYHIDDALDFAEHQHFGDVRATIAAWLWEDEIRDAAGPVYVPKYSQAIMDDASLHFGPDADGYCGMRLGHVENGWRLTWTDGASEWTETFAELSVALMRAAAVVRCVEANNLYGFRNDQASFERKAYAWLAAALD